MVHWILEDHGVQVAKDLEVPEDLGRQEGLTHHCFQDYREDLGDLDLRLQNLVVQGVLGHLGDQRYLGFLQILWVLEVLLHHQVVQVGQRSQ